MKYTNELNIFVLKDPAYFNSAPKISCIDMQSGYQKIIDGKKSKLDLEIRYQVCDRPIKSILVIGPHPMASVLFE